MTDLNNEEAESKINCYILKDVKEKDAVALIKILINIDTT